MRFLVLITFLFNVSFVQANGIKQSKSDSYNKALLASTIKLNPKPVAVKKKIRNLYPILVPKKPTLNGNFSHQLTYKKSQKKSILRSDDQSPPS